MADAYEKARELLASRKLSEAWPCAYANPKHKAVVMADVVERGTPCCRACSRLYRAAHPKYERALMRAVGVVNSG